jgi:hypothetical protein
MAASGVICVLCILSAGLPGSESTIDQCRVTDVVRYCGNGDFICKVDDVPRLEGVQVRVQTRGLLPAEDPAKVKELDQVMAADLSNAGRIILKHVRMRNYFRVEADVEVDGRSLAETLVSKGVAQRGGPAKPAIDVAVPQPVTVSAPLTTKERALLHLKVPQTVRPVMPGAPRADAAMALRGTTDVSQIREETTFEEALEIIRHAVAPPLPMVVMWKDIEDNAFIEKTTPVGIEGLGNTTLGQALKLVLLSVSSRGEGLEYVVEEGIVTIASKAMGLGDRRYTRAYDAGELLATPAGLSGMMGMYGGGGGGGGYGGGYGGMGGFGNMGLGGMGNMGSMGNFGGNSFGSNPRPGGGGR